MEEELCLFHRFLNAVYDDFAVAGEGSGAFVSNRTFRAWSAVIGESVFEEQIEKLCREGSVVLLNTKDDDPEFPRIEILFYV